MRGNVLGQAGGGAKINGIIEEYKVASGGNVNAGDFVEFVNDWYNDTRLTTKGEVSNIEARVFKLNDNKILILHVSTASKSLSVILCEASEDNIIVISDTIISDVTSNPGRSTDLTMLSDNRFFVVYAGDTASSSSYYRVYGTLCEIQDNTVNVIYQSRLSDAIDSAYVNVVTLTESKVAIVNQTNSGAKMMIYNITNSSFDFVYNGSLPQASTQTTTGNARSLRIVQAPNNSNLIFVFSHHSSKLYGTLITYENDELTIKYQIQLSDIAGSGENIEKLKIDIDKITNIYKIIVVHGNTLVCSINATLDYMEINYQSDLSINTNPRYRSIAHFKNKILILWGYDTYKLHSAIVTLTKSKASITKTLLVYDRNYTAYRSDSILLENYKILVMRYDTSTDYLNTVFFDYLVKTMETLDTDFAGISKNKGVSGNILSIIQPNI